MKRPEVLTADKGYGSSAFVTEVLDRDLEPHIPLLSKGEVEELPTWERRTFDLERMRARKRNRREAEARNRVRELMKTAGYAVSRKLRIRSEHVFAEGKTCRGLGRARRRGLHRVQDQATLTAVVQNLKRLVAFQGRKKRGVVAAQTVGSRNRTVIGPRIRLIQAVGAFLAVIPSRRRSTRPGSLDRPSRSQAPRLLFPEPEMPGSSTDF